MSGPQVLPISGEAAALSDARLAAGPDALAGAEVTLALQVDGVLHFVTPPPRRLDERLWAAVVAALDDTAAPAGRPVAPDLPADAVALPVLVRLRPAAVLLADRPGRPFTPEETALLRVMASLVATSVENGRLHANLVELFAEHMSSEVASTLLADPTRAQLGGQVRDVSVLFADLHGFTGHAERHEPAAVVALLNRYFEAAVPAIVEHGGTVSAFIGDAIMGLFGAPTDQPEHPLLAARAALALRDATAAMSRDTPDMPRVRVGVNTGPAIVGNIGTPRRHVFTAIGDTVNLASRLEGVAAPGTVVIGPETHATIRSFAEVRPLGPVTVKGKSEPVAVYELLGLRSGSEQVIGQRTVTIDLKQLPRPGGATGDAGGAG